MKEKDTYTVVVHNATGMLEARRHNCDCTGYCLSREHANEAFKDPRFKARGFYLLISRESKWLRVYIGDSSEIKGRFVEHCNRKSQKFDWEKALIFLNNSDQDWNGDETYDLQGIILNRLRERGYKADDNIQHPRQRTSEDAYAELEVTANHIDGFFNVLGFPELAQVAISRQESSVEEHESGFASGGNVFSGHTIWGDASLSWDGSNGFKVLAGSRIRTGGSAPSLGESGVRNRKENAKYYMPDGVLKKDVCFRSPSAASDFVSGTPTQGTVFWKDTHGVPIRDYMTQSGKSAQTSQNQRGTEKSGTRKSITQLAKALAAKYNECKSIDYAIQILGRRAAVKRGKWRVIMERVGLKFDAEGYVVDWTAAAKFI